MKTIIVGNGTSVLAKTQGCFVDSHDVVIRLGSYRTEGFEEHVGSKTSIWANGLSTNKIWKCLKNVTNKMIWIIEPSDHPTECQYIKRWQSIKYEPPHQCDKLTHSRQLKDLAKQNCVDFISNSCLEYLCASLNIENYCTSEDFLRPSLGVCCIAKVLENHPAVNIIGFDCMKTGWYWDPSHKHCYNKHSSLMEKIWLEKMKTSGRVIQHD